MLRAYCAILAQASRSARTDDTTLILYHFTISRYVESIRKHGILSMAEKKRRGMYPPHFEPPPIIFPREDELVWLTKADFGMAGIQGGDPLFDTPVRISVEMQNAKRWKTEHVKYKVPQVYMEALRTAAARMGEGNFDRDWYVVEGIIPAEAIVEVVEF